VNDEWGVGRLERDQDDEGAADNILNLSYIYDINMSFIYIYVYIYIYTYICNDHMCISIPNMSLGIVVWILGHLPIFRIIQHNFLICCCHIFTIYKVKMM
jgi:hypothetical protein